METCALVDLIEVKGVQGWEDEEREITGDI